MCGGGDLRSTDVRDRARVPDLNAEPGRLRRHHYTDLAWYDVETEHAFRGGWLPVCRVDQVAHPGDRYAVDLAGRPLVVTRAGDGTVRVLGNVCQHRGALIAEEGCSRGASLICPYHRWSYRADGSLIGGPLTDGVDLSDVRLPVLRHAVWEGFVLVNLSGDAPDPVEQLSGLSRQLAPWSWSELVTVGSMQYRSDWNWKVMVENWIECYHHLGSHRRTVEPYQPAHTTSVVPDEGAPWVAMTVDSVPGLEGDPGTWLPGVTPARARHLSVWAAFPLLLGGSNSRYAFWLHVVPVDVVHHEVTWHILAHPSRVEHFTDDWVRRELDTLAVVHAEDMHACRSVQRGIASGMIDEFRLTRLEAPIASFHRWLLDRCGTP
jgi:phenylpropionate dioxygenase-like ring-hydroxylating dioxygenase large terminal subunit